MNQQEIYIETILIEAPSAIEEVFPPVPLPYTAEHIVSRIEYYAARYEVSYEIMYGLVRCETAGTFDPNIQSGHFRPNGEQEQSYGLVQIYLPAHPYVSYEQATDVDFSLEFLASNMAKGNHSMWSCYNILYGP